MTFLLPEKQKNFHPLSNESFAQQTSYTTRIRFLGPRKRVAFVLFGEYPDLASSNNRTFPYAKNVQWLSRFLSTLQLRGQFRHRTEFLFQKCTYIPPT